MRMVFLTDAEEKHSRISQEQDLEKPFSLKSLLVFSFCDLLRQTILFQQSLTGGCKLYEDRDPICVVQSCPLELPAGFLMLSGHSVSIYGMKNSAKYSSFPHHKLLHFLYHLISLLLHGWYTVSSRHQLLFSSVRNTIRILYSAGIFNTKISRLPFSSKDTRHAHYFHSIYSLIGKINLETVISRYGYSQKVVTCCKRKDHLEEMEM